MYSSGLLQRHVTEGPDEGNIIFALADGHGTVCPRWYPSLRKSSPLMLVTRFPNGPSVAMTSPLSPRSSSFGWRKIEADQLGNAELRAHLRPVVTAREVGADRGKDVAPVEG